MQEDVMAELNPQPLPPVQIYVSRDVTFDLEKMQKITATVLEKLGCGGCHSGRILDFVQLDQFAVDPATLEVQEVFGGLRS
jgi:hypothetical protein